MKKSRTIPFGYMMQNGVIQPESTESKAVQDIFNAYLNGSSLLAIANQMSSQGVSYNGVSSAWNKNMVKRILENEKYLGRNGYPAIIDEDMFCRANMRKKIKSTTVVEISEELQAIRSLTYCTECCHRISRIGGNTRSEKWDCRNPECSRFSHRITDQMLIGAILNTLNTAIANPDLLDANSEISRYTPSIEVTRQQNEISRLMDTPNVDFETAKEEIFKLAELKYDCCTYSDKPQKTTQFNNPYIFNKPCSSSFSSVEFFSFRPNNLSVVQFNSSASFINISTLGFPPFFQLLVLPLLNPNFNVSAVGVVFFSLHNSENEQLNKLDIGLLKSCVSRILVSHFCTVEIEFINGVTIKNITERKDENEHCAQCQDNSCEAADCGKQG